MHECASIVRKELAYFRPPRRPRDPRRVEPTRLPLVVALPLDLPPLPPEAPVEMSLPKLFESKAALV